MERARVDLCGALPSCLGATLAAGTADVGLLPVVEAFRGRSGGMIPGIRIACQGAVDSVKLFHRPYHLPADWRVTVRAMRIASDLNESA